MLLFIILALKQTFIKEDSNYLYDDYELVTFGPLSGNYTNSEYKELHKISKDSFDYASDDKEDNSISSAFDDNEKTYWVSTIEETGDFHPSLYITFKSQILFEAFTYQTGYRTLDDGELHYDGFPTKLKLYSALNNDDQFKLVAIFTGSRQGTTDLVQFVLSNPILCTRLKLEFIGLSYTESFNNKGYFIAIRNMVLYQNFGFDIQYHKGQQGLYKDSSYIDSHTIKDNFIATANGEQSNNQLKDAFDVGPNSGNTKWVCDKVQTDDFHPQITINFTENILFEGFIYGVSAHKKLSTRYYDGFPNKMVVYTALDDAPLTKHTEFVGKQKDAFVQFILAKPVRCSRIMLEFHEVTDNDGQGKLASCDSLTLLKSFEYEMLNYQAASGDYENPNYIDYHRVPRDKFSIATNGDREPDNSIEKALDTNDDSNWISAEPETDTFKPTIYINFTEPTLFEGLVYVVTSEKKTGGRNFFGFPGQLLIYTSLEDEELTPKVMFHGGIDNTHVQAIFTEPINCTRVVIEFRYVSQLKNNGGKYASADELYFLRSFNEYEMLRYETAAGKYVEADYIDFHQVPRDKFSIITNGDKGPDNSIEKALDTSIDSTWISAEPETDTFKPTIYVNFTEPTLFEGLLYDATSEKKTGGRDYFGFPGQLHVFTFLGDEEEPTHKVIFYGQIDDPHIQAIFTEPINCTRVVIEFYYVSQLKDNGGKYASADGLHFFRSFTGDSVKFERAIGKYVDDSYVALHKVKRENLKIGTTGDMDGHSIELVFDDRYDTYWVSDKENTDDFHASISINFTEELLIEAFLFHATLNTKDKKAIFHGFPLRLNVYSSLEEDGPLTLNTKFAEVPITGWDLTQFVFPTPVRCRRMQLEFYQITPNNYVGNLKKASVAKLSFISQEMIVYSNNNFTDVIDIIHVNPSFYYDEISNATFIDYSLPKYNDYLFVVERDFEFYNDTFQSNHYKVGAIKSNEKASHVLIDKCQFLNCAVKSDNENGGAINFINCAVQCQRSDFIGCKSTTGGKGGGIYLTVNRSVNEKTLIEDCTFKGCTAYYGGAVFAYSKDKTKEILIQYCTFRENQVINDHPAGSAIYLMSYNSQIVGCRFRKNVGSCTVKIVNEFNNEINNNKLVALNDKNIKINVKDCSFEIDASSLSSISLTHEDSSSSSLIPITIDNCIFTGNLAKNAHHIDAMSIKDKNELKLLHINECKFASDRKRALNLNNVNVNNLQFNFVEQSNNSGKNKNCVHLPFVVISAVFVISVIVALIVIVQKRSINNDGEN